MASKNNGGFLTFLTGMAMGAAAVFFSKKENRTLAQKKLAETKQAALKLKTELKTNPNKVKKELVTKGKTIAGKVRKEIHKKTA